MKKSTVELLSLIKQTSDFSTYSKQNANDFIEPLPLHICLTNLLTEKSLKKSEVIRGSGLDRGYGYDIFSGTKQPSRDKLLAICFSMQLSTEEVQQLLKTTGYPILYAKIGRDSAILFALEHHWSLIDANELLFENGYPHLA